MHGYSVSIKQDKLKNYRRFPRSGDGGYVSFYFGNEGEMIIASKKRIKMLHWQFWQQSQ